MTTEQALAERWNGMLLLPPHWRDFLREAGETGMGYQTGDVILTDGQIFRDVIFMNPYLGGIRGRAQGDIPFEAADINQIRITHRRWKWDE